MGSWFFNYNAMMQKPLCKMQKPHQEVLELFLKEFVTLSYLAVLLFLVFNKFIFVTIKFIVKS